MDRNAVVAVFLLFLIVADVSDASLPSNIRKLVEAQPHNNSVGAQPNNNSTATPIPSPSPVSEGKKSKPVPNDGTKKNKTSGSPVPDDLKKDSPVPQSPNTTVPASPPPQVAKTEAKNEGKSSSEHGNVDTCVGSVKECKTIKNVVACIKSFDEVSKTLVVVIQNERESSLEANISLDSFHKVLNISKHQNGRVDISHSNGKGAQIFIQAANEKCVLPMDSPVEWRAVRLPSYDQLVTPINGAYLLIFTVLIFGVTWACCMFRKRRRDNSDGVPYQELEMGIAETVSATALETAEGWDQGWDDDWDEDKAVKSPGGHVGSISANGLTSRTANRDGWEINWND